LARQKSEIGTYGLQKKYIIILTYVYLSVYVIWDGVFLLRPVARRS